MLIHRARNSARITAAASNKHHGPRSISRALKGNTARHPISRAPRSSGQPPDCGPAAPRRSMRSDPTPSRAVCFRCAGSPVPRAGRRQHHHRRCVVSRLSWNALVDGAARAEGLALPDVPPTVASAGRRDPQRRARACAVGEPQSGADAAGSGGIAGFVLQLRCLSGSIMGWASHRSDRPGR
jgi:hypothetical protein